MQAERDALQVAAMHRGAGAAGAGASPLRGAVAVDSGNHRGGAAPGMRGEGAPPAAYVAAASAAPVPGGGAAGGGSGEGGVGMKGPSPVRPSGRNVSPLQAPSLQQQMQQLQLQQADLARMDPKTRRETKRQQEIQQREAELLQVCTARAAWLRRGRRASGRSSLKSNVHVDARTSCACCVCMLHQKRGECPCVAAQRPCALLRTHATS